MLKGAAWLLKQKMPIIGEWSQNEKRITNKLLK